MRIDIVSLFPELYAPLLSTSIPKRAADKKLVDYHITDIRDFGEGSYNKVDDRPFGGGPGMVMMPHILAAAVDAAEAKDARKARRVLLTPAGRLLKHALAAEYAKCERLVLIATHYEGYDERFVEEYQPDEVSIGDYVLSGGELAAMVVLDAVVRLVPGVLGHDEGASHDSFAEGSGGLLEHAHYTRPREWRGREVPEVLMGGDHKAIDQWRLEQRRTRTLQRRPDLWTAEHEAAVQAEFERDRKRRERTARRRRV
jgi:tRNA (guanine37-N1)-methyltransferase